MNFKKISGEKQTLNEEIDSVKQTIQTAEKELASLTIYRKKEKKAIEVQFHAGEDQQIKIEVGYLVEDASWRPVYKIDVAQDLHKVGLTMLSKIYQKTGEDWKNIHLTVSNATPVKGGRLPETAIWDLDIARPQPVVDDRDDNQQTTAPVAALKTSETETSSAEAEFIEPVKKEMPFSFEYGVSQMISVDSSDDFIQLPVFHKSLTGEFSYMAVPKTSPSVFLICRTTTDSEIMDGPVNVHFGSHFIGKAFMGEKKAGEAFDINIGADRAVKIKRQKEKDTITETFFGAFERNTTVREMEFTIVAENLKNETITINILDSIPVSRTDKILVENINIQPQPSEKNYQGREGILLWSLSLKPDEVKKISLSFTISYPKDEPVMGL